MRFKAVLLFLPLLLGLTSCVHDSKSLKKSAERGADSLEKFSSAYREEVALVKEASKTNMSDDMAQEKLKKIILVKSRDAKRGGWSWFFDTVDMTNYPFMSYESALRQSISRLAKISKRKCTLPLASLEYGQQFGDVCQDIDDLISNLRKIEYYIVIAPWYLKDKKSYNKEIQSRRVASNIAGVQGQLWSNNIKK